MASSTFQWQPDGSAVIIVNGHTYRIQANALAPGQTITVGGQKVGVPAKPAAAPVVQPYLEPEEQARLNDMAAKWDEVLSSANLGLKQAGIQLNELDLPQIGLRAAQQGEAAVENAAGRGLSMSGIRDSAIMDVERARVMAETAARAAFQAAQDRYDATQATINAEKTRTEDWARTTAGANAARANANIEPPYMGPQAMKPPGAGAPGGAPKPAAPGPAAGPAPLPAIKPGVKPAGYVGAGPPGPDYIWTGTRWTQMGEKQPASHGNYGSGPPPGPDYYWNGTRWVKSVVPRIK